MENFAFLEEIFVSLCMSRKCFMKAQQLKKPQNLHLDSPLPSTRSPLLPNSTPFIARNIVSSILHSPRAEGSPSTKLPCRCLILKLWSPFPSSLALSSLGAEFVAIGFGSELLEVHVGLETRRGSSRQCLPQRAHYQRTNWGHLEFGNRPQSRIVCRSDWVVEGANFNQTTIGGWKNSKPSLTYKTPKMVCQLKILVVLASRITLVLVMCCTLNFKN